MMLNAAQFGECAFRRQACAAGVQPGAHDAIQDQGDETNGCVRANPIRQPVVDEVDFNFRLQHPKASFDICQ